MGKYLPPFQAIFKQEIPIQKCFDQNFSIICCTFCDKLNAQSFQENISCTFKQISAKNHYQTLRNTLKYV